MLSLGESMILFVGLLVPLLVPIAMLVAMLIVLHRLDVFGKIQRENLQEIVDYYTHALIKQDNRRTS